MLVDCDCLRIHMTWEAAFPLSCHSYLRVRAFAFTARISHTIKRLALSVDSFQVTVAIPLRMCMCVGSRPEFATVDFICRFFKKPLARHQESNSFFLPIASSRLIVASLCTGNTFASAFFLLFGFFVFSCFYIFFHIRPLVFRPWTERMG